MPGGDDFGARPIDMHVAGLEAMGATFKFSHGYLEAFADRLHGADITFDFPSVGATENLSRPRCFADGRTTIDNAAREPEITDLCEFLVAMGAQISGVGTSTLVIEGVERGTLRAVQHHTVPDRIQAATYVAAVAVAGGELAIEGARPEHMTMLLDRFADMGLVIEPDRTGGTMRVVAPERLRSIDVATLPYPGIATDYKPLIITMLAVADGVGIVTENLYPGRFRYVEELQRLGADVRTERPPRGRARRAAGCRVRRCGLTTSEPVRPWSWPGWLPRARPRSPACTTSTAATTISSVGSPPSAPHRTPPHRANGHASDEHS